MMTKEQRPHHLNRHRRRYAISTAKIHQRRARRVHRSVCILALAEFHHRNRRFHRSANFARCCRAHARTRRGPCPRLIALLAIGVLYSLVYPGEVLKVYAVVGLLVLPVMLKAPRWLVAVLAVTGTIASFAWVGSSVINVPPLFLLGAAAAAYGLPARLEHPDRRLVLATAEIGRAHV